MTEPRDPEHLRKRTKAFALAMVQFYDSLNHVGSAEVMGRQCLRSATSAGAQYREACRARSDAEFISKMEGALQELDETCYWLELFQDSQKAASERVAPLWSECDELIRMFVACVRNTKGR